MDTEDEDVQMLDEMPTGTSFRTYPRSTAPDGRSLIQLQSFPSASSSRPSLLNGRQHSQLSQASSSAVPQASFVQQVRATPDLAQHASHLSIETQSKPSQSQVQAYLDDLGYEEDEAIEPFRSELPTGYCYDVRMRYHCELDTPKDRRDYHPEDPRRIFAIYKMLCEAGLVDDPALTKSALVSKPLLQIQVDHATEAEIELVHDKRHWDLMTGTKGFAKEELIDMGMSLDSVYFCGSTFANARLSAGGAIEVARAVASGLVKNAIAIVRPPGHHAEANRPMGFCIFDNVSIATKVCQADYPEECRKVLIVDWDVHHGNGVQQAFESDPNVLYISLHVHEGGNFYPSGNYGDHKHIGLGEGVGYNVNIPWPTKGMGDADYLYAFQQVVMPIAQEFDPDLVMIAAGFDAAEGDQLGGCFVTPACYAHMTHMLKGLANGKIVVCLEGGYNLRSIARSALAVTRTLNGEPPPRLETRPPSPGCIEALTLVKSSMGQHWRSLFEYTKGEEPQDNLTERTSFASVYDNHRSTALRNEFDMVPIPVYKPGLAASFKSQVMATPNFEANVPLVVLFHDPPEIFSGSPINSSLKMETMWMHDGYKSYAKPLIEQGMAFIDINIPRALLPNAATDSNGDLETRTLRTSQLADYLWDNYIELNTHPQIFFIGVGLAYQGILALINARDSFRDTVTGIISIIPGPSSSSTPPISSASVPDTCPVLPIQDNALDSTNMGRWYKDHSLILVGGTHPNWKTWSAKRPSKRYGNVVRSGEDGVAGMLRRHRGEVLSWIGERSGSGSGMVGAGEGRGGGRR